MGTGRKENTQESDYGTAVLCVVILALAVLPYFLWPVRISPEIEDAEHPAGVQEGSASSAHAQTQSSRSLREKQKRPDEASAANDPLTDVLRRIQTSSFEGVETVMAGRYLKQYRERQEPVLLETTDLDQIRLLSRGDGWIFLEAPYTPEDELYVTRFPWEQSVGPERTVELRMVERNGSWKLEHMKIVTRP